MSIKFRVLGGFFFWGGSADFIFMGAGIFLILGQLEVHILQLHGQTFRATT